MMEKLNSGYGWSRLTVFSASSKKRKLFASKFWVHLKFRLHNATFVNFLWCQCQQHLFDAGEHRQDLSWTADLINFGSCLELDKDTQGIRQSTFNKTQMTMSKEPRSQVQQVRSLYATMTGIEVSNFRSSLIYNLCLYRVLHQPELYSSCIFIAEKTLLGTITLSMHSHLWSFTLRLTIPFAE